MTEDEKRKFSGWESLRDHAWREFEDKSRAEWRLSFGIWAALLASASALIASEASMIDHVSAWEFVLGALIILFGHAVFLYWIQRKLNEAREFLSEAQGEMRELLKAPIKKLEVRSIWRQVPMYVEFGITILLIGVLGVVLKGSGS